MILVVSPGSWEFTYAALQHADWNGWTLADLVFPDFLFGVGMALGLVFARSPDPDGKTVKFSGKVARRVVSLIILGLGLNYLGVMAGWFGAPSVGPDETITWRIPGVLQRIAVCYLLAVLIVWATSDRADDSTLRLNAIRLALAIAVLLIGYWALVSFVPVPGFGAGNLSKAGNLPAYVDRAIFTPTHMWALGAESWRGPVVYDPEGILSSLPATANVLFGAFAVTVWQRYPKHRVPILMLLGLVLLASGLVLDRFLPINKKIWSSSFVLLTSGFSCLALVVVAGLIRIGASRLLAPLKILGGNAILAFSLSIILGSIGSLPIVGSGEPRSLQAIGFETIHRVISDPYLASLTCAFGILALILMVIWPLDRRGIHLRL
jgi:predicted acyltransferase